MAVTLTGTTHDYKGEDLKYSVTYEIPIRETMFDKWPTRQCIAETKRSGICMILPYKEQPLVGLCWRHYKRNLELGGSTIVKFGG